jgi:hypothetical protein
MDNPRKDDLRYRLDVHQLTTDYPSLCKVELAGYRTRHLLLPLLEEPLPS